MCKIKKTIEIFFVENSIVNLFYLQFSIKFTIPGVEI